MRKPVDIPFLTSIILLLVLGVFIFFSASVGVLIKDQAQFSSILFNQLILGLLGGIVVAFITSRINYKHWRIYAFWIYVLSIIVGLLVFVPGIGIEHGGAKRWINLGFTTFQSAELIKIGTILYAAAIFTSAKDKIHRLSKGLIPLLLILLVTGAVLLAQPDTDNFILIAGAVIAMYFVAGCKIRDIVLIIIALAILGGGLIMARPYLLERVQTFIDISEDPFGSGYQIRQSLIAIGSGGLTGRGFGQSIQKFKYLPEPIGDSIFAVFSEEWGFMGAIGLIILYLFFALRGIKIATFSEDTFGRLIVVGFVILIVSQSFMNMASMLGLIPLSGLPLLFVSHGGTALLTTLFSVGIMLNISRYQNR